MPTNKKGDNADAVCIVGCRIIFYQSVALCISIIPQDSQKMSSARLMTASDGNTRIRNLNYGHSSQAIVSKVKKCVQSTIFSLLYCQFEYIFVPL